MNKFLLTAVVTVSFPVNRNKFNCRSKLSSLLPIRLFHAMGVLNFLIVYDNE